MNTLNPFQLLHFASSALTNRPAKNMPTFFPQSQKPQYLCFPPLKKINIWQLSYVFAVFLIFLCFWHCQHTLQYAAVPLVTFWNSFARNTSSQRIELACIIYTVDSYEFCAFSRILLLILLFRWVRPMCRMSQFCDMLLFFVLPLYTLAWILLMVKKNLHFLTDQAYFYGYYFSSVSCSIITKCICHIQIGYLCSLAEYQSFPEPETGFWASSYTDKNRNCNLSQVFAGAIPAMDTTLKIAE